MPPTFEFKVDLFSQFESMTSDFRGNGNAIVDEYTFQPMHVVHMLKHDWPELENKDSMMCRLPNGEINLI